MSKKQINKLTPEEKMAKATGRSTSPHVLQCLKRPLAGAVSRRVLLTSVHGEGRRSSGLQPGPPFRADSGWGGAYASLSGFAPVGSCAVPQRQVHC